MHDGRQDELAPADYNVLKASFGGLGPACLTISVGGVRLVWLGKEKKRIDYNVLKAAVADGAPDGRGAHAVSGRVPFDRERRG